MASLLAKTVAFNPLIRPMFRPAIGSSGSSSRFYNSGFHLDDSDEFGCKLNQSTDCVSNVTDVVKVAFCPRVSATRNLARILNSLDVYAGVNTSPSGCPRWDVIQDPKALYIVRDMTELPLKDEIFQEESTSDKRHVFGCVRVCRLASVLHLIVGTEGPNPGAAYQGYRVKMWLPSSPNDDASTCDIKMGVKNEVLTIIIPKETKGEWIHKITMLPTYFTPVLTYY